MGDGNKENNKENSKDRYVEALLLAKNDNVEGAIHILNEILAQKDTSFSNDFLTLVYTTRAQYHYQNRRLQQAAQDINQAVQHGCIVSKDINLVLMLNHCTADNTIEQVILNFEKQAKIRYESECQRVIKLVEIFDRNEHRERSQSADRQRRK